MLRVCVKFLPCIALFIVYLLLYAVIPTICVIRGFFFAVIQSMHVSSHWIENNQLLFVYSHEDVNIENSILKYITTLTHI